MKNIQNLKSQNRKTAFTARKKAHESKLDHSANAQLFTYLQKEDKTKIIVASYMPIRTEISPLPTMHKLAHRGYTVCVPVITAPNHPLNFHRWTPMCEMIDGKFGALIPKETELLIPDIIITPLVAFDQKGNRLGYGGGYYDRSFQEITAQKSIHVIGFAYSAQKITEVPCEATDYKLHTLITEKDILSFE